MRFTRPPFPGLLNGLLHYLGCLQLAAPFDARLKLSVVRLWYSYFRARIALNRWFFVPEPAVLRRARVAAVGGRYSHLVAAETRSSSLQSGCLPASAAGQAVEED